MPNELWAKIHEEAARESLTSGENVTRSDIIRSAVDAYCNATTPSSGNLDKDGSGL